MRKNGTQYVAVRAAAERLKKAPPTVRLMLERDELDGVTVHTESGHRRQYVSVASLEAFEAAERAKAAAEQQKAAAPVAA